MDEMLRKMEREYLSDPRIATLLPYAKAMVRAGLYAIEDGIDFIRVVNANDAIVAAYSGEIALQNPFGIDPIMGVMADIETQRRRNEGNAGPDCIALWMSIDGYEPNPHWVYNGQILS